MVAAYSALGSALRRCQQWPFVPMYSHSEFAAHLERLQNPPDCRAAALYVYTQPKYTSG